MTRASFRLDLATSIFGSETWIDCLVHTIRQYRASGNLAGYVHVGVDRLFTYDGIDVERDLGIVQHLSPHRHSLLGWHIKRMLLLPRMEACGAVLLMEPDQVWNVRLKGDMRRPNKL